MPAFATHTYTSELYERPALTSSDALDWPGVRLERYQLEGAQAVERQVEGSGFNWTRWN